MAEYEKKVRKILKQNGCHFIRNGKGDHEIWENKETGKRHSLSLINKRSDEGDWEDWSDKLPAQFLAKQNLQLVNRQLYLTKTNKEAEALLKAFGMPYRN